MALAKSQEYCYSFFWKLENINYSLEKKGEKIESPTFIVDTLDQTKWKLIFYPKGYQDEDWISCFLHREADSKGAPNIKIKFELVLIRDDDSYSDNDYSRITEMTFSKNSTFGCYKFAKQEEVFLSERSIFIQQGTLTIRCRIWNSVLKMMMNVRCFARTRISVRKTSSYISLNNFSTLESNKESIYQVRSLDSYQPLIDVYLTLTGGLGSFSGGTIRFGITLRDITVKYCALRMNLVDSFGNLVKCNEEEFWFDRYGRSLDSGFYSSRSVYSDDQSSQFRKEFTFLFTKKQLISMKDLYLPNDNLMIQWELALSKGILSSEIEEVEIPIFSKANISTSSKRTLSNNYNTMISSSKDLISF
ncbi:unnamed protein product [Larinioides sclopetarius]|uniref:MATH domain-containing protein n=1 Tax=Larinioides sclopetarius TaxID=280406 RepID=A0AAV2BFK2_9ARAC